MRRIKLTKGYYALVDDKDYERVVAAGPWHAAEVKNTTYAVHTKADQGKLYLHRFVVGVYEPRTKVDHKDRDGLNCRRNNIRKATSRQNQQNRRKVRGTSKFKGVHLPTGRNKWHAHIVVKGKDVFLGTFSAEKEAATAYDIAARKYFGKFANTNF